MPLSPTKKRRSFFNNQEEKIGVLMQIAREYGRTKRPDQLASEFDLPRNVVQSYATNMRSMGIDIPRVKAAGIYVRLLEEIKRKHPTLLTAEAKRRLS